jgi:uroporphyrinogen III methyltransferase / synthase
MNYGTETPGSTPQRLQHESLRGRRIVMTRATEQAGELTTLLQKLGADVIHCPTIEIVEPNSWAPADTAIANIDSYDWVLFTSVNSVEFFVGRLSNRCPAGLAPLNRLVKFAIGSTTAGKLRSYGFEPDVVSAESTGEASVESIINAVGHEALNGLRMLFPRAKAGRDALPDGLRKLGVNVDVIEIYQTITAQNDCSPILKLLRDSTIDAITFTSPSTVASYVQLVGTDAIGELGDALVACIGPTTAAAAREIGMRNIVYPEIHNARALVELLAERLAR